MPVNEENLLGLEGSNLFRESVQVLASVNYFKLTESLFDIALFWIIL